MEQTEPVQTSSPAGFFRRKWPYLLALMTGLLVIAVVLVTLCWQLITPAGAAILDTQDDQAIKDRNISTGLVLGAGISAQGLPYKELEARLDAGAEALAKGWVQRLILSGDNRFVEYNEPEAMRTYLIDKHQIDTDKLVLDQAGRSTYESCERAARIFGQKRLIIFSAGSHLPRAIYLCRHFGIDAYGISSGVEANNSGRREILARVKAVFNVYIRGEKTVLGDPIVL